MVSCTLLWYLRLLRFATKPRIYNSEWFLELFAPLELLSLPGDCAASPRYNREWPQDSPSFCIAERRQLLCGPRCDAEDAEWLFSVPGPEDPCEEPARDLAGLSGPVD